MQSGGKTGESSGTSGGKESREKRRGRRHNFFQRSESTLCLGCPPPDPFAYSLAECLPLAEQPQLLQPNARREDLFGTPKQPAASLPTSLGLAARGGATSGASAEQTAEKQMASAEQPARMAALSTAPFQAGPSAEANFERIVNQQQHR